MNKTHYKDFFKSNTLQDNAFDPERDTIVTITAVNEQKLMTKDGPQNHLCAMLDGYEKPLRINKTIAKNIAKALGTPDVTRWKGGVISIYIEKGLKAFGEVHDVPRVRPLPPRINLDLSQPLNTLMGCSSLEQLTEEFYRLPANIQKEPKVLKLCTEMKQNFLKQQEEK